MIKAGIIGGAGYTAGELIRLLINHPDVEIKWINSTSNAGNRVDAVHQGLIGETDLTFTADTPMDDIDVMFCCTPHGETRKFLESHIVPDELRIIDLSTDYRHQDGTHDFVYGLPELNRKRIVNGTKHIANPGCFATCIQLALLPALKAGLISGDIHVNGITGSTGAGQKPSGTTHFSWRNDNISVYKTFRHQHLLEINQTIQELQPGYDGRVLFIPQRGCFARGIFVTAYAKCDAPIEQVQNTYSQYYADAAFTHFTTKSPDMKQVVNTNKAVVYVEKFDDQLLMICCIDNLLKGAVGQAVQNMNLMFGIDETCGLRLKASAF